VKYPAIPSTTMVDSEACGISGARSAPSPAPVAREGEKMPPGVPGR
jgi:hypothetical protein